MKIKLCWKFVISISVLLNIDIFRPSQSEPAPPLLNCPYPECLSSHLSPPPTPPPPPFPLPSQHHYPVQWSFIQKEELREQDWCSLEPEDHSLKRLSHTGSRVSKKEKIYFKSSPDANIHHNHASSSSSSSVSKTPAMSFKSPEPSTLSRPLLFAQCNKEAEVTEKTSFQ